MTEKKRGIKKHPTAREVWHPPEWAVPDADAVRALVECRATPEQQKRAVDWILFKACMLYDMSYRPGDEGGRRDTDFGEGRRFVGNHILLMAKLNLAKFRTDKTPREQD